MNFFYIEETAKEIAKSHNNAHCIKMILEYAQMLSTTHRVVDQYYHEVDGKYVFVGLPKDMQKLYKIAHLNHPTTIWVRESVQHYNFMYDVFEALCDESMTFSKFLSLLFCSKGSVSNTSSAQPEIN